MLLKNKPFWIAAILLAHVACVPEKSGLETSQDVAAVRALNKSEREKDFDVLVESIRSLYAPLHYKEKRFGFKFDDLVAEYGDKVRTAQNDEEYVGVLLQFLTRFQDGHISLSTPVGDASTIYRVPLFLIPVENRAIIAEINEKSVTETHGIEVGDEILEIDGINPFDLLPIIKKYKTFGNEISDQHFLHNTLIRPAYITELKPTRSTVRLKIAKRNGEVLERELVWNVTNSGNSVQPRILNQPLERAVSLNAEELFSRANISKMSEDEPFWLTPQVLKATRMRKITPSQEMFKAFLKEVGLPESTEMPKLFAAVYRFNGSEFGNGKTLLLFRIGTYDQEKSEQINARIAWYKALLADYKDLVDALVIDQTHNGGGYLSYGTAIVSLFANGQTRGLVNFLNADRRWLSTLSERSRLFAQHNFTKGEIKNIADLGYRLVEDAIDNGLRLTTQPIPLGFSQFYIPPSKPQFDKPVLILIDELSGSTADIMPLLMKENGLATLFGERTAGLGGNVETVVSLPNSNMRLSLTRGFFAAYNPEGKYDFENGMTENNGVEPDIRYSHTVEDVRAGYINYVREFSKAAASLDEK